MKKYVIFFMALCFLSAVNVNAQAFQKGNKNIDVGIGFGGYGTHSITTTEISFTAFGVPFSQSQVFDTTDGAASMIIPISFEYGISNKFGLGVDLTPTSYFIAEEDRDYINSVKGFDIGVKASYHILDAEKNDLFVTLGVGTSSINWKFKNDETNVLGLSSASGSGTYFSFNVSDRIFFSDNLGLLLNLGYRGYKYPKIEYDVSDANSALAAFGVTDAKISQELEWSLNGVQAGIGLAVKF